MRLLTNLDLACAAFRWKRGTIHQVAQELGMSGCGLALVDMEEQAFIRLLREHMRKRAKVKHGL